MAKIKLLSIIVPMYNEKETILKVLSALNMVKIRGYKKEVVIVDDGSKDFSDHLVGQFIKEERLKDFKLKKHSINLGKGGAVRTGIEHSKGDLIMFHDADLEYNPKEIPKLIKLFSKNKSTQVVYGSRFIGKSFFDKQRWAIPSHFIGNILLTKLTNFIYDTNLTDMETGYKVMTREALNSILPLKARGFDLEPEITAKLLKRGYKIKEVPISYKSRTKEEGKKITVKDGLKAMYYLWKYQFID